MIWRRSGFQRRAAVLIFAIGYAGIEHE